MDELQKLALLEASDAVAPRFDPALAVRLMRCGHSPLPVGNLEKAAAALLSRSERRRQAREASLEAIRGKRKAGTVDGEHRKWIDNFRGAVAKKAESTRAPVEPVEETPKVAGLFDGLLAPSTPSTPLEDYSSGDGISDFLLMHARKKQFMRKSVKNYLNGREVRPPPWWDAGEDAWNAKLEIASKKALVGSYL